MDTLNWNKAGHTKRELLKKALTALDAAKAQERTVKIIPSVEPEYRPNQKRKGSRGHVAKAFKNRY